MTRARLQALCHVAAILVIVALIPAAVVYGNTRMACALTLAAMVLIRSL